MASKSKYPNTVTQEVTPTLTVPWTNLDNLKKNIENNHAVTDRRIQGKKYAHYTMPSPILANNFQFNLPEGAEPTKVTVEYRYRKTPGNDYSPKYPKRICNIPAPEIYLSGPMDWRKSKKSGVAPTTTMTTYTKTWDVDGKLTRQQVNATGFGVYFNFKGNSNDYDGWMRFAYVRVRVEYRTSSYAVSMNRIRGGYAGDEYSMQLIISNKNRTNHNPTLTLTTPVGFNYKNFKGRGTVTRMNATTFRWNPDLTKGIGSSSVEVVFDVNVIFPSGVDVYTGRFELTENLNNTHSEWVTNIYKKPEGNSSEIAGSLPPIITNDDNVPVPLSWVEVERYEGINISLSDYEAGDLTCFAFPADPTGSPLFVEYSSSVEIVEEDLISSVTTGTPGDSSTYVGTLLTDTLNGYWLRCSEFGKYVIVMYEGIGTSYSETTDLTPSIAYYVESKPVEGNLNNIAYSVFQVTGEELDRLGHLTTYTAQSYMKHETTDISTRDWYFNCRVGVFNNSIADNITITTEEVDGELVDIMVDSTDYSNLTLEEIFENADYWSENRAGLNDYESVECDFTYNEDYPLFIILTSDYNESSSYGFDSGKVESTTPCIIESDKYSKWELEGNFPFPIKNLILGDGSSSETTIPEQNKTNTVIIYDYGLDDGYGNTETRSIRGLELTGTIQQTDDIILYATLTNTDGIQGQRSVVIGSEDSEFTMGGLGDIWSFSQSDLHDLEDWELSFTIDNLLEDSEANINLGDLTFIIYTEDIERQLINVKVNGEDLNFYGAFVEDVNIPAGLDTDTSFLTIDGTDTNDPYRQNIRTKTISLDLSLNECDLQTNTDMLRQLTKLLVNERDSVNRPIPNIIEFSHYPDIYFEYILTDALQVKNETGGYLISADLTIPAGTSFNKTGTTTNVTGNVQGIAAVNPIITFRPQANTITITEEWSKQSFHMSYDASDWSNKVVEIDCEDRRVYIKEDEDDTNPIDITNHVDFDVDWFRLHGEYNFSGAGCVIRTVKYVERW